MKGYCGIDCSTCECFQATMKNDDRMRMNIAIKWSRMFGYQVLPREVHCTGCQSKGIRFKHCDVCKIRKQHEGRGIKKTV